MWRTRNVMVKECGDGCDDGWIGMINIGRAWTSNVIKPQVVAWPGGVSEIGMCVRDLYVCVSEIGVCVCVRDWCVCQRLVCVSEIGVCVCQRLVCVSEVGVCVSEAGVCKCECQRLVCACQRLVCVCVSEIGVRVRGWWKVKGRITFGKQPRILRRKITQAV
jgi:hypothetical protein